MFDFISQYLWVVGLVFLLRCVPECERRAYGLANAGRLSAAEAASLTRFVWLSAGAIAVTTIIAQFTYAGPRGACALYADPLRPQALLAWVVLEIVLLRIGGFVVTRTGRAFLTRAWPAVTIILPLARVWPERAVVRQALSAWLAALLLGIPFVMAIVRPGSVMRCGP